jgi:hypothetical protein
MLHTGFGVRRGPVGVHVHDFHVAKVVSEFDQASDEGVGCGSPGVDIEAIVGLHDADGFIERGDSHAHRMAGEGCTGQPVAGRADPGGLLARLNRESFT